MDDDMDDDMNDDVLRRVLSVLDDEESARPALVERVWADVESLLRDEPSPVRITELDDRAPGSTRAPAARIWLVAAAAVLVVGLSATALVRSTADDRGIADESIDSLPAVTVSTTAVDTSPPTAGATSPQSITLADACATFREAIGDANPLVLPEAPELPATATIEVWVDELGTLLATLERIDDGPDSSQVIALQLMRTSLRSALDDIADADAATARLALTNASLRLDATPPDCLPGTEE